MPPLPNSSLADLQKDRLKKPRNRHSPAQIVALNELYDQDEHPALELRSSLAERLGMSVLFPFHFYLSDSFSSLSSALKGRQRQSMPGFKTNGLVQRKRLQRHRLVRCLMTSRL